nr:MAG TPA: hypothetical protein [Caudoviricetes sp.]
MAAIGKVIISSCSRKLIFSLKKNLLLFSLGYAII